MSNLIIRYSACGHLIPAGNFLEREQRKEIEKAANGQKCPVCRAQEQRVERSKNA